MNTVIETTLRRKNNNKLFDKFWYKTREERFLREAYEGLFVDTANLVIYNMTSDKLLTKGDDEKERERATMAKSKAQKADETDKGAFGSMVDSQLTPQRTATHANLRLAKDAASNIAKAGNKKEEKLVVKKRQKSADASKEEKSNPLSRAETFAVTPEKADSVMSFNPGSPAQKQSKPPPLGKHVQVELNAGGAHQTMKFISSDALKERFSSKPEEPALPNEALEVM